MKYWLHERVTLEIATPKKNTVNRGDAVVFEELQFPMLHVVPFCAGNINYITLNVNKYIIWFQNKPVYINFCIWGQLASMVYRPRINSAQSIFSDYHLLWIKIDRCQHISCVRTWLNDSVGVLIFYQISLSRSE